MGRKPNSTQSAESVEQTGTQSAESVEFIGLQTLIGTGKYAIKKDEVFENVNPKIAKLLIAKGAATLKE